MKITGAQAMVECLLKENVNIVFGYPGAAIAPFYDSLSHSAVKHVLTRTEQGAGHAASGYARISGRPGVCIATSGPGATNLFTAIATAYGDSIPMIAITGQVATESLGRDVFQEVDTIGAVEPFTKYSYLVKDVNDIPGVFREAFHIASTGRKGPVLIDIPVDIQNAELEFSYPENVNIRGYKPPFEGHPLQIRRVAEALRSAKCPLICVGGGVFSSGAAEHIKTLCESASLPLVSTMMGIGTLPPEHALYFGMLGQSGFSAANTAVRESDLLVLIGARVGDRAIERPASLEERTTVIHIDIDAAEIGKNLGATIPLVGDAARVVARLLKEKLEGDRSEWLNYLSSLREKSSFPVRSSKHGFVNPHALVKALSLGLGDNGVYVADVGMNQIWSSRSFSGTARFLTTGGMGTMGYSIPAAIGAKHAAPQKSIAAVCGDGAFQMTIGELATIVQQGLPVKIVVMRNGILGMIRSIQHVSFGGNEFAVNLSGNPDIGLIAKAYGFSYSLLDSDTDINTAVNDMLASDEPYILECVIDPEEDLA